MNRLLAMLVVFSAAIAATASSYGDDARQFHRQAATAVNPPPPGAPEHEAPVIDPAAMFDRVVERYQGITTYEDTVVVEQVTARSGEPALRDETHIRCAIDGEGRLAVTTPAEQMTRGMGLGPFLCGDTPADEPRQYDLWLAPHLALRFAEHPLESFRSGVAEGFTPVKAEKVTIRDEELVRIELRSGDGLSEDYRALYELFVNPRTLLIMRVRGVQLLPDGANLLTDFTISPKSVVTGDGVDLALPAGADATA